MKKKSKVLVSILSTMTSLSVASLIMVDYSVNKNDYQNNNLKLDNNSNVYSINSTKATHTINVGQSNIDISDVSSVPIQFASYFEKFYPEDLMNLQTNTAQVQYILEYLISYRDKNLNTTSLFSIPSIDYKDFYDNYSQLKNGSSLDDVVSFRYDDINSNKNVFSSIANGEMDGIVNIGKNIQNIFQFDHPPLSNSYNFKISGLIPQYDIYFRNEAIRNDDDWNETNVADDNVVTPFVLQGVENKSLLDETELLKNTTNDFLSFLTNNNLIIFNNENGKGIKNNDKINAILATNLVENDFKKNGIIKDVLVTPFVGSGKVKIELTLNTAQKNNVWKTNKEKSISDSRGTFYQTEIDYNVKKTFWLSGWKKDYSFNKPTSATTKELDANNLFINDFSAFDIQQLVSNKDYERLFRSLILFNAYKDENKNDNSKLITTNLTYEEFAFLIKKYPFNFLNKEINNFDGKYSGKLFVNNELVNLHYVSTPNSEFSKFDATTVVDFQVKNLKKIMIFKPKSINLDPNGFIELNQFSDTTISNFFSLKNHQVDDTQKFKRVIFENLVRYNYDGKSFNENDYANLAILTNAKNITSLNNITTLEKNEIFLELDKGRFSFLLKFIFDNGVFNDNSINKNKQTEIVLPIKISGFKPEINQKKYDFDVATTSNGIKTQKMDIDVFNSSNTKPLLDSTNIDYDWVIENLISYELTTQNKPYNIYTTSATKEEFLNEVLYKNSNHNGITLRQSLDYMHVDGTIYINKEYLNKSPDTSIGGIQLQKDYWTFNFRIYGFSAKPIFEHKSKFDIQKFEKVSLDDFDKIWLIDNLFSFSDLNSESFVLKTNLTKNYYLSNVLDSILITKNYTNKNALIKIIHKNQETINIELFNFESIINFVVNENIKIVDNQNNYELVLIDHDFIVNHLMNFDGSFSNNNSILNTNISLAEFTNIYLEYINIIDKNFQNNYLDLEITFKKVINGKKNIRFKIFFNPDRINIYNVNTNFSIDNDSLSPENFQIDDVYNYISFNGTKPFEEALFSINMSESEFKQNLKSSSISMKSNIKNGTVTFSFELNKSFNIDINTINNIEQTQFSFTMYGFKSIGIVNFTNTINAQSYKDVFGKIEYIENFNSQFIYDNLISYNSDNGGIIGNTNMSKEEFIENTIIDIKRNNKNVVINFLFKTKVNKSINSWDIIVKNLSILGYNEEKSTSFWIIIGLSISLFFIITIPIFVLLIIRWKNKRNRAKFNATIENTII